MGLATAEPTVLLLLSNGLTVGLQATALPHAGSQSPIQRGNQTHTRGAGFADGGSPRLPKALWAMNRM